MKAPTYWRLIRGTGKLCGKPIGRNFADGLPALLQQTPERFRTARPREAAADQLARMIARLSDRRRSQSEAQRIASVLIERLPTAGNADRHATGTAAAPGFRIPTSLGLLALVLAMVVGLIAGGYLSFGG